MLRPWSLLLQIDRQAGLAVHLQIAQYIVDEIQRGRLTGGSALPGTREIARQLGVNRKTVIQAFDELIAQGWLCTQGRRGTFVLPALITTERPVAKAKIIKEAVQQLESHLIDFTDGVPDSRLIPFDVLGRAYRRALIATARANRLAYGDPRGELPLRQALCTMLSQERGLNADVDQICVVRGSQMGIYLAARVLLKPGDAVALDTLTYPPARAAFQAVGAQTFAIAQDESGMRPNELEQLCQQRRLKAIYLTPHHQFPTTTMMPPERRMQLLALADRYGFVIIEDDYDHEFHFAHRPVFPLASISTSDNVIYISSLSKVLAPGLRLGYVFGPQDFIDRCAAEVMLIDRQGNAVTELAVTDLMQSGELKRHIRRALRIYESRRNIMAEEIKTLIGDKVSFDLPNGGLALWLKINIPLDMQRLQSDASRQGVKVLLGSDFAAEGQAIQALRLGYGSLEPEEIKQGIQRLARAMELQIK
jgi:GntR family transcriptional regulator/MocR family aminotransferase